VRVLCGNGPRTLASAAQDAILTTTMFAPRGASEEGSR